jgi:tetratricopeptide (TPR) repeat protein
MIRKTCVLVIVVFGLVLAVPTGLGLAQGDESVKILAQISPSLISLVAQNRNKEEIGRGTAVAITKDLAVTSYHLVSLAANCIGFNAKKKGVDINGILTVNKALDLALVRYNGKVTPLALAGFENVAAGKKFFAVGSNESGDFVVSPGEIKNVFDFGANTKVADANVSISEQATGGAAVDAEGRVFGIFQVLDKRLKAVMAGTAVTAMATTGKETPWKNWMQEDYVEGVDNAWLCARLYAWANDLYGGQRFLERVTKAQPENLEAWKLLAKGYDAMRDYQSAIAAFKKVTELDPQNAEAFYGLGQILTRMQRSAEAIAALEKAIALAPDKKEIYFAMGSAYDDAREFGKAGDAYDKYLASNPDNPGQAYERLGKCRFNGNEFEKAAVALEEARKSQPDNQNIAYYLAQAYQKAKNLDKAEAVYKSLAQVSPKDAISYNSAILNMYYEAGQWAKAIESAQKLIELKPNDEQFVYNLGFFYQQIQKYPEAIDAFKKATAVKPDYQKAWFQIGWCYYTMKNYKEAIPIFQKNVTMAPDDFNGWLFLGMSYMQLKDHAKALDPMKKAVDLDPANANALFNLGVIYLNLKDRYSAQDIAKKLQQVDPALATKLRSYIK